MLPKPTRPSLRGEAPKLDQGVCSRGPRIQRRIDEGADADKLKLKVGLNEPGMTFYLVAIQGDLNTTVVELFCGLYMCRM